MAQEGMSRMIHDVQKTEGIDLVLVEAAAGNLDAKYLEWTDHPDINRKMAECLAGLGEMTGADLYLSRYGNTVPFVGIENPALYRADLAALRKVYGRQSETNRILAQEEKLLDAKITRLGNTTLTEVLRAYLKPDIWNPAIKKLAGKFPAQGANLVRYIRLREEADGVHLDQAKSQWQELRGKYVLGHEWEEKFFGASLRQNPRFELEKLYAALYEKGFNFKRYPEFVKYVRARIYRYEMDPARLHPELRSWLDEVIHKTAQTPAERAVAAEVKEFFLQRKLLRLELTREEWEELKKREASLVKREAHDRIRFTLHASRSFYRLAESREQAFLQNIQEMIRKYQAKKIVVITGGFHVPALMRAYRQKQYRFTLLSPRVGNSTSGLYRRTLMGRKAKDVSTSELASVPLALPSGTARSLGVDDAARGSFLNAVAESLGRGEEKVEELIGDWRKLAEWLRKNGRRLVIHPMAFLHMHDPDSGPDSELPQFLTGMDYAALELPQPAITGMTTNKPSGKEEGFWGGILAEAKQKGMSRKVFGVDAAGWARGMFPRLSIVLTGKPMTVQEDEKVFLIDTDGPIVPWVDLGMDRPGKIKPSKLVKQLSSEAQRELSQNGIVHSRVSEQSAAREQSAKKWILYRKPHPSILEAVRQVQLGPVHRWAEEKGLTKDSDEQSITISLFLLLFAALRDYEQVRMMKRKVFPLLQGDLKRPAPSSNPSDIHLAHLGGAMHTRSLMYWLGRVIGEHRDVMHLEEPVCDPRFDGLPLGNSFFSEHYGEIRDHLEFDTSPERGMELSSSDPAYFVRLFEEFLRSSDLNQIAEWLALPYFAEAWELISDPKDSSLDDAARVMRLALNIAPGDAHGWEFLAWIFHRDYKNQEAEAAAREALAIDPSLEGAQIHLIYSLMRQEKSEEAEQKAREILREHPEVEEVSLSLASILIQTGRHPEGEAMIRQMVESAPEKWIGLGIEPYQTGVQQAQRKLLEQALEINERDEEAHIGMALLEWSEKNFLEAEVHFREAVEANPKNVRARILGAQLHLEQGGGHLLCAPHETMEGLKIDERVPELWLLQGHAFLRRGWIEHAKHAYDKYRELTRSAREAQVPVVEVAQSLGHQRLGEKIDTALHDLRLRGIRMTPELEAQIRNLLEWRARLNVGNVLGVFPALLDVAGNIPAPGDDISLPMTSFSRTFPQNSRFLRQFLSQAEIRRFVCILA
ncbi:MAG: tetratricopeptide repeat protein [Candidatus Omnitrophica bacterium]|nr:tetratricopeptide repeat protein [Candidatus Omnitrophota bacterium]